MSDPHIRHDGDDEPTGAVSDDSTSADRAPSPGHIPIDGLALLSSAPLSSELNASEPDASEPDPGGDDAADHAAATESSSDESVEATVESTVEALINDLERVTKERDGYLDDTRRLAAEFANFRRQNDKRQLEVIEQAAASLVERLLPVLDACDGALAHGAADVEPIYNMLINTLEKSGLTVMRPLGEPFDPNCHDAVIHEPGDGDGPHVAEVLRTGYEWNGRVVRPALVKVRD